MEEDPPDLDINGWSWCWWPDREAGHDRLIPDMVSDHEEAVTWSTTFWANVNTEGSFMWGIAGHVWIYKLADYYEVWDEETMEGKHRWCDDPRGPVDWLFYAEREAGVIDHYIEAPFLQDLTDEEVGDVIGCCIDWDYYGGGPHAFWINGELWEWPTGERVRRKTCAHSTSGGETSHSTEEDELVPREIRIGRLPVGKRTWIRVLPTTDPSYVGPDVADESHPTETYLVALPPSAGTLDLRLYEQLLEAAFKYPWSDFGDKQPAYALLTLESGAMAYGCVIDDREGGRKLAQAFGSLALYRLRPGWLEVTDMNGDSSFWVQSEIEETEPPLDRSFEVSILTLRA